ncbi:MAG: insulinase family protein [Planctomycetes bacterium]|nr:insulinase family protein [Planctomycetota bacterium]
MNFEYQKLDNGLTIIGEVNPLAQSAAVGFFVRTGARDETPEISGVSHYLEHMLFKGTDALSALEVNAAFDRLGAKFNAFTSEENTVYYAAVLPEYLMDVAGLWMQLMRPSLRDDDFDIEKNVILEEIAMYKDLPQFEVMDQARALHFGSHPCGSSVLGTNESVSSLTAEQMRSYFSKRYAPNNMVLACSGNFDFEALCQLAEKQCAAWNTVDTTRELDDFRGTFESKHIQNPNLMRQHICLLSPALSMQDPRRFAASLLGMILGDDSGSRYYWGLTEPALAEIAAMQCESMDGTGAFYSYLCCDPDKASAVLEVVRNIFAELKKTGVSESELETAKNKMLSAVTIKCEQPMGRLVSLGFNWIYNSQYQSVQQDVDAIKAVSITDISNLIQQLNPSKFTMLSLGPNPE